MYAKLIKWGLEETGDRQDLFIEHCACLYLATKVNEFELVKIRDIINVVHFTMHSPESTLDQMEDFEMDEQARH